ncbi:hypothetical protein C1645_817665 [Glomus cerebriforme]|uniref:Uncharacterized protein n=1 Tax=Glomus cerebriforme TaxID=658196 RepID=A0A397TEH9_9GLOM|nr:hypothetical protein C1645_817665 [Glomus cerebriforme]
MWNKVKIKVRLGLKLELGLGLGLGKWDRKKTCKQSEQNNNFKMSDFYENELNLLLYDDDVNYENESEDLHNTFYNKLEDSPLKEIYSEQTFTSFKVFEQIENNLSKEILNPIQHKGKGQSANKRYLLAIENRLNLNNQDQDEVLEESRKKNKRQCAICKSWYYGL